MHLPALNNLVKLRPYSKITDGSGIHKIGKHLSRVSLSKWIYLSSFYPETHDVGFYSVNVTLPNTFTVPLLSLATSGTFTIGFSTTIMPPLPTAASSSSPTTQTPTATVLSAPPVPTSSGAAGSLTGLDGVLEKVLGVVGSLFILL